MNIKHVGLFSGIGGFEYAAQQVGWQTIAWCEIDTFCQTVLKYHFPNAQGYSDIRTTDFTIHRGKIDVLTGGFPCQPFSTAGKRLGKEDDRFFFYEAKRVIREIRPRVVILENVAGLISILEPACLADLESEAIQFYNREHLLFKTEPSKRNKIELGIKIIQERVLAEIIKEIEAEGYLLPWTEKGEPIILCIPAAAVNAPHRRDRVVIVAFNSECQSDVRCSTGKSIRNGVGLDRNELATPRRDEGTNDLISSDSDGITSHTSMLRCKRELHKRHRIFRRKQAFGKTRQRNNKDGITSQPQDNGQQRRLLSCRNRKGREFKRGGKAFTYSKNFRRKLTRDTRARRERFAYEYRNGNAANAECSGSQGGDGVQSAIRFEQRTKEVAPNPNSEQRCKRRMQPERSEAAERHTCTCDACSNEWRNWQDFPTQSPICSGNDGISSGLDLTAISFSKWRTESIKGGGNAIVPPLFIELFKIIDQTIKNGIR